MTSVCNFLKVTCEDFVAITKEHRPSRNKEHHELKVYDAKVSSIALRIFGSLCAVTAVGTLAYGIFVSGTALPVVGAMCIGVAAHDVVRTGINLKKISQTPEIFDNDQDFMQRLTKDTILLGHVCRFIKSLNLAGNSR